MPFSLIFSAEAKEQLESLERSDKKKYKKVQKTLGLLETNPAHPGLHAHKYESLWGPNGERVWEAYVENKTPAAFRVFYFYGPARTTITVLTISPHP
jgi:hypothetical protein